MVESFSQFITYLTIGEYKILARRSRKRLRGFGLLKESISVCGVIALGPCLPPSN